MSDRDVIGERVAHAARVSYGRLVAILSSRSGDIAAAEDHLAEAFRRALESWPEAGVPSNPEAWLLTVARNLARDSAKSAAVRLTTPLDLNEMDPAAMSVDPLAIPDERLKLMFACAHPAIDEAIRTPLILQTVLGLEAAEIGAAFLVPGATMAQRLVRAKQKIKAAGIPFVIPETPDMPPRIEAVLDAIYGIYALHWIDGAYAGADAARDLNAEALFLASLVAELLPDEPEALGLAALIGLAEARRDARLDEAGRYVPLAEQDTALWNGSMLLRAERLLSRAEKLGRIGRFQIEAAIQSVHAVRRITGRTDWPAVVALYEGLLRLAPSVGGVVGLAAALGQSDDPAHGPSAGIAVLDAFAEQIGADFQPWWATRGRLLAESGQHSAAREHIQRAIDLSTDPAIRDFLATSIRSLPHHGLSS
ncbi:MAG: RNA polymerase sigma factor [Bosea sp. (in: a-proteobacteria)]